MTSVSSLRISLLLILPSFWYASISTRPTVKLNMASTTPYQAFGLSCPDGGIFYVCENSSTEFIGCCAVDACSASNNGTCPQNSLRVSSFSSDVYQDLPKQDCDDPRGTSIWWTCKFNRPPFMGCCSINPCANGQCPIDDLVPAKLSNDAGLKASFLTPKVSATPTTISTQSTSSTLATTTTHSSPSTTGIPQASDRPKSPDGGGLSGGAIGGIAAGAAIVIIIIIAGIMYRCGWHARKRKEQTEGSRVPSIMSQNLSGHGEGQSMDVNQYRGSRSRKRKRSHSEASRC